MSAPKTLPPWAAIYTGHQKKLDHLFPFVVTRRNFYLLRAITLMDVTDSGITATENEDVIENTICFEIVGEGPDVKVKGLIGRHCIHLASTADALNADGDGRFWCVHEDWVPLTWDPNEALKALGDLEIRARLEEDRSLAGRVRGRLQL